MKARLASRPSAIIGAALGLLAFFMAALLTNHGLVDSTLPAGPGLTLDESFNITQGVYLADAITRHGPLLFTPTVAKEVFQDPEYLPDHPPLARIQIGLAHEFLNWAIPGSERAAFNVPAARLGSCLAFGLMTTLLFRMAAIHFGTAAATLTALLTIASPRMIGHARLASLESGTSLAWVIALIPLLKYWTRDSAPTVRQAAVGGLCWGILLLTKIQAVLLAPAVIIWALARFRQRAVLPLGVWGFTGFAMLLIGWPWLWENPVENLLQYLGRTTDRLTLYCWYLDTRYADRAVPWHFPSVMLISTLSPWTLLGLALRFRSEKLQPTEQLLILTSIVPLLIFSVPGVPVYDGIRLFLVSLPGLCLIAARGFAAFVEAPARRHPKSSKRRFVAVLFSLILLPLPWSMQPFAINQYGPLCGGNRGAAALGLESGFWADALNGDFWAQVPLGSTLFVAPVSHQFQLDWLKLLVPAIKERKIQLLPWEYDAKKQPGPLLLIHRLADLRPELQRPRPDERQIAAAALSGVLLARVVETAPTAP